VLSFNRLVVIQYICFGINADNAGNSFTFGSNGITTITIDGTPGTGIKSLFNNRQIKIYPNPFGNQVTIDNNSETIITKVTVTYILGRNVLALNPEQTGSIHINTQSFDNGLYFIKVFNKSDNFTVKLIKE
jgi:hypothetical protein